MGAVISMQRRRSTRRDRNDLRQYDDLMTQWWRPEGPFAALHWLAASRRALVPAATDPGQILLDLGCGGGLMADTSAGYVHVGVDLTTSALVHARGHGLTAVRGDVSSLPIAPATASVVVAGEILEHVHDLDAVVAEICRVLRPGGTVLIDTINDTRFAGIALVHIAERLPGGPPRHIHDPSLFVDATRLQRLFAAGGVDLDVWGLRPSVRDYLRFLVDRRRGVAMVRTRSTAGVYQGVGVKVDVSGAVERSPS
jgi:2-polyprenyl-6-hydroxyphenyl methylase/3-demethylubiquinone-9 3-methyltransferase